MSSLKEQTISGLIWTSLERFGTMGISFITNLILARLLSPDDFGTIGMLAIFIMLSNTFVEGGFGAALIQKKNPSQTDYSTVFYWNIFLSLVLYGVLFMSSPFIAYFFKNEDLCAILRVQALILIPNSLSVVHANILRKQLQFKVLARMYLVPAFLGASCGVVMAYCGFGVWSLVAYQLVNSVCLTIMLWFNHKWVPGFAFDMKAFRQLFSYGGFLLISSLLNTLMENIQGLLIGKNFSASTMGYYTQAKKLQDIPVTTLSSITSQVTFPVFSKINDDIGTLNSAHRRILKILNFLVFPLMIMLIAVAEPLFIVLFSEKWINSIPLFKILCLSGLFNCFISVNYQLFVSSGRSKQMFGWNIVRQVVCISNIVIGMYWGVEGMLYAMVLNSVITFAINSNLARKVSKYNMLQQIWDVLPIMGISVLSGAIVYFATPLCPDVQVIKLLFLVFLYIAVYIGTSMLFRIESLKTIIEIAKPYMSKIIKK